MNNDRIYECNEYMGTMAQKQECIAATVAKQNRLR
jgi:hypothetical protein